MTSRAARESQIAGGGGGLCYLPNRMKKRAHHQASLIKQGGGQGETHGKIEIPLLYLPLSPLVHPPSSLPTPPLRARLQSKLPAKRGTH